MQAPPAPKKPISPVVWIIIGVVLMPCLCFGGCSLLAAVGLAGAKTPVVNEPPVQAGSGTQAAPAASTDSKPDLQVLNTSSDADYVTGTVINNTDKTYKYAQIEISLLDKDGAVVGSALANVNNLGPGQKWKFKATTFGNKFDKYQVKSVTGF